VIGDDKRVNDRQQVIRTAVVEMGEDRGPLALPQGKVQEVDLAVCGVPASERFSPEGELASLEGV
jgi:hypothetical protein